MPLPFSYALNVAVKDVPSGYSETLHLLLDGRLQSERDLVLILQQPWNELTPGACLLAARAPNAQYAWPLLKLLNEEILEERLVEIAKALARTAKPHLVGVLTKSLRSDDHPPRRWASALALSWMDTPRVVAPLSECLQDDHELSRIRGQAAEGLGLLYSCRRDPRSRRFRKAETALIKGLQATEPEVRFWCAYSLAVIRSSRARGFLRHIARHDHTMVPGWWAVAEEAADAVTVIDGGHPEPRELSPQPVSSP